MAYSTHDMVYCTSLFLQDFSEVSLKLVKCFLCSMDWFDDPVTDLLLERPRHQKAIVRRLDAFNEEEMSDAEFEKRYGSGIFLKTCFKLQT